MTATATIIDSKGQHEVQISPKIYEAAHDAKCSVPQYLQREYGKDVDVKAHGSVFNQLLAQTGLHMSNDKHTGIRAAVLGDVMNGTLAATTRDAIPLSRILAPAAILELVEVNRAEDKSSDVALFNQLIANDVSIAGNRYEQPVFDSSSADEQEISRIGQLQVPNLIGKLTVSQRGGSIPTFSYGLEISNEALKALTIDQVAVYLTRMAASQAASLTDLHINSLVNGDKDIGQAALAKVKAKTFDSAAAGKLTHSAYVKWLRAERRKRTISHLMCDLATYEKIVNRDGRPTAQTVLVENNEIHAYGTRPMNYEFTEPQIYIVNDGVIPTNTIVGLDHRFAIARIRNTEAAYQATEELVMRKGTQMRFDEGSVVYRIDDTAWSVLDLTA